MGKIIDTIKKKITGKGKEDAKKKDADNTPAAKKADPPAPKEKPSKDAGVLDGFKHVAQENEPTGIFDFVMPEETVDVDITKLRYALAEADYTLIETLPVGETINVMCSPEPRLFDGHPKAIEALWANNMVFENYGRYGMGLVIRNVRAVKQEAQDNAGND